MKLLFVIEHVFSIKDRGVLVTGEPPDSRDARYRMGDSVHIRCHSGSAVQAAITGIPFGDAAGKAGVLLGGLSELAEVRAGDEVWVDDSSA